MEAKTIRLYRPDEYERQAQDFYKTPAWVTKCLTDTVPLRGFVWEPCAGDGAMVKVLVDAGYKAVASDLVWRDGGAYPVLSGVDALQAALPAGVRAVVTNPPYRRDLLPQLIEHWLGLLEPVGGQLCLLLASQWGESASGQALTSQNPVYAGRVRLPRRIRWFEGTDGSPQHTHNWMIWDFNRDRTRPAFDVSSGDERLLGCAICTASLGGGTGQGAL